MSPFTEVEFADGMHRTVWTTFTDQQIDIDVEHPLGWTYLIEILDRFRTADITTVRLDAVGYAIKWAGTSCFMLPETLEFIRRLTAACHERSMAVLVEMHGRHLDQLGVAPHVDLVYDFVLQPHGDRCCMIEPRPLPGQLHVLRRVRPRRRSVPCRPHECFSPG